VRVLALETSATAGSLAALCEDRLLAQTQLDRGRRSAQSLAPALAALWQDVGWQPADVELVAVTIGPGSFTGLRVGVTTAKILAYAVRAEALGVDTLAAIAPRAPAAGAALWGAIDAQRGQVVAQPFRRDESGWLDPAGPPQLVDIDAWLAVVQPGWSVSGPILRKVADRVPSGVRVLDPHDWDPMAADVGRIAWREYRDGRRDDLWKLAPRYSRRAAAEEKRLQL